MGSDHKNAQDRDSGRRRSAIERRRDALLRWESLERRTLLSNTQPVFVPTSTNIFDVQNGPMANEGSVLIQVYSQYLNYQATGKSGDFADSAQNTFKGNVKFSGDMVGVTVYYYGSTTSYQSDLVQLGFQETGISTKDQIIEGYIPIKYLPNLASVKTTVPGYVAGTTGVAPMLFPVTYYQGEADNEADTTLQANTARAEFGVTGAGTTVGVLSDSVNEFNGGLAASVATGDLPSNVNVLEDGPDPTTATDEGRAMLENVHDIAPGSSLAFHTAANGLTDFASGIEALATQAGAKVIVDDIGYDLDPYYSPGVVAQAITDVTDNDNVAYFSAAGNAGPSGGIESAFRGVSATLGGVTGTFMQFDPGNAASTTEAFTVNSTNNIVMQYDQPFGSGVTSQVNLLIFNAAGTEIFNSAAGNQNNIATQMPFQLVPDLAPGNYTVAVEVPTGTPLPGRIAIYANADYQPNAQGVMFSQQYGTVGGITYPSTFGHSASADSIGVGASPYYLDPPVSTATPIPSENFSSTGPAYQDIDANGNRIPLVVRQEPVISASDGGNTSFFGDPAGDGSIPPGVAINQYNLPNFFGTSSAAPNAAAVSALIRQLSPTITSANISSDLIASTLPMNGTPKGQWNPQSGYGLIQATTALQLASPLLVTSATPSGGQVLASAPQSIVFTFNRAIDPTTLQASDLTFPVVPPGVTVTVGTPAFSASAPNVVVFPLSYSVPKGGSANGIYTYALLDNSITATNGKLLTGYSSYYGVADVIAPKITNVTLSGRYATIQFSEPMNPATINLSTVLLVRTGASGVFNNPTNVIVTADPRSIVTYNIANNTATLDLSQLNQSELPSDNYNLIVTDSATDIAGNRLDGEYTGTFPTGNGVAGGTFNYYLPNQQLLAPQIVTLRLAPSSDSGIAGDNNTNDALPTFIGTVTVPFPGTAAGVGIVAQINALNNGVFDLSTGPALSTDPLGRSRGFVGTPEASTTTDAAGNFTIQIPRILADGFDTIRVVAVGQSDRPPLAGYSSSRDLGFRIDTTVPSVVSASPASGTALNSLTMVTLNVSDPVLPNDLGNPQSVPIQFSVPALNPATADNISNYSLINLGPDLKLGTADDVDESSFITGATFIASGNRLQANAPYTGQIVLTFAPGLPAGFYALEAHRPQPGYQGITDAAGNSLDGAPATNPTTDYVAIYDLNPEPAYITSLLAASIDPNGSGAITLTEPRSYYEVPVPGVSPNAPAPPTSFYIDFSQPLDRSKLGAVNPLDPNAINPDYVQLIRSADSNATSSNPADGDFGFDPSFQIPNGGVDADLPFTRITGTTLRLVNSIPGATFGQPGYENRLVLTLAPGTTLPPDHYRLFIPNAIGDYSLTSSTSEDLRLYDVYGNQIDGEFLGNPLASDSQQWQDLLPTGEERAGLSGDGVAGGSFETSYIVVPNGNVIFARPDYQENPLIPSTLADGTPQKPYPALAPEAVANSTNGGNLNSIANFANFNPDFDYNGNGQFDLSAFYAASQLSANGPVVIVAEPAANTQVSTVTGISYTPTFVLQSKALNSDGTIGDGSASVPFDTDLVFEPESVLKLYNATLFVQNQGSSIQVEGGANPSQKVTFTSLFNDSVDGPVNGIPATTAPTAGDWGGIALRNFDDQENGRDIAFPVDGVLGVSGADDALSILNNVDLSYGGGIVPRGANVGTAINFFRYDEITLFDARPVISNAVVSDAAPTTGTTAATGTQAGISVDLDSLRDDQLAQGPLIRQTTTINNSINGIYVRAEASGFIEQTDAEPYLDQFSDSLLPNSASVNADGTARRQFSMFAPLPYVLITRLDLGTELQQGAAGAQNPVAPENRLYIDPGSVLKFQRGAALEVVTPGASLNVGSRSYMDQFDANNNFGPGTAGFSAPGTGDAQVIFTSLFDNNAATVGPYLNPSTGLPSIIVPMIDSANSGGTNQPTGSNVPPLARWGDISVISGGLIAMNDATIEYGGGQVNQQGGTITQRDALNFQEAITPLNVLLPLEQQTQNFLGTKAYITNNNFFYNEGAAIGITPDGLKAADPLRPLESGNPFLRGNLLQGNDVNALEVLTGVPPSSFDSTSQYTTGALPAQQANLFVNSVWDLTDITYAVRGTVAISGDSRFNLPINAANVTSFQPELQPKLTLTLQSALPGTMLANGQTIAKPGESLIVKLLNPGGTGSAPGTSAGLGSFVGAENQAGAGFTVGYDNGVDPPADPYLDAVGVDSQLRITGIAGNESTGQTRVPVIITSLRDDSIGTTVRGVSLNQALNGNTTAPAPGDGGLIVFGANQLIDYNLLDPRDGSVIDNADISYMTRIELQGGGIVEVPTLQNGFNYLVDKLGITPDTQLNASRALAVTDTNINNFSEVGILTHPGPPALEVSVNPNGTFSAPIRISPSQGEPTDLLTINDTISNTPIGVSIIGEQSTDDGTDQEDVTEYIALNNTYYNDTTGVMLTAAQPTGTNLRAHIHFTAMDNIFANDGTGVIGIGQLQGSQGQYNLFSGNGTDVNTSNSNGIANILGSQNGGVPETGIDGNADFVNAAGGDLQLGPDSSAIDAARSELSLDNQSTGANGATLRPLVTQELNSLGGIRIADGRLYDQFSILGVNDIEVNGVFSDPVNVLTLPGGLLKNSGTTPQNFFDEWVPVLPGTPGGVPGPANNAGDNYWYEPIGGQRDQLGNLRVDDPNVANVGTGSEPFFDIGAFEYRQFNAPKVTAVNATIRTATGVTTVPFYTAGSVGGSSSSPISIQITFSGAIDPTTLNGQTVLLEASGGTGAFGKPGQSAPPAYFINLSGKLSYDTTSNTLTINLSGSNLNLGNDEYRLFLLGSGSNAITNPQGIALDGINTVNDDPNNPQLPLPSGFDNTPGSNFYLTFYVNNQTPTITPSTFMLSPASITGSRDDVTKDNTPTFVGSITATFPPANAAAGQTVVVDISTKGNGVYDLMDAGTGTTGPNGTFSVTINTPLPDSPINVGPDGLLGTADDLGYSTARVRVVDQAGNSSSLTDPNAVVKFVVDTRDPFITVASPASGSEATNNNTGVIPVAITVDENLNPATLNASSILVTRAGPDGVLGTADDVSVPIDPSSITLQNLFNSYGSQVLHFNITGATANDEYQVTLKGTGSSPITDIAANPLAGEFTGTFPTGGGVNTGSDFNLDFFVYSPANSRILFVEPAAENTTPSGSLGDRNNPYPTIMAAMAASNAGDTIAVIDGEGADPNVYDENVVLKPLVRLVSADPTSNDGQVIPGLANETIIRGNGGVTINATNVQSLPNFSSEISGFTIASLLVGNPSTGPIDPNTIGILTSNSDILIDKNYVIDSGVGIASIETTGISRAARLQSNGVIGNVQGISIDDLGASSFTSSGAPTTQGEQVANNTVAFNTIGLVLSGTSSSGPQLGNVVNNIFWQNSDGTAARHGEAIYASVENRLLVQDNLFFANGANTASGEDDVIGVGGAFNPATLGAAPDLLGNFVGNPAFVAPRDPRPTGDGPAAFLLDADFDPTLNSAAIDNSLETYAPALDFLYRARVDIPNKGFPGRGPADLGAFEYNGTPTIIATGTGTGTGTTSTTTSTTTGTPRTAVVGGASRVITTSLVGDGSTQAAGAVASAAGGPSKIDVTFSNPIDPATVKATDLILTGGLDPSNPAHATSATLLDDHTIEFGLTGGFQPGGTVQLSIPSGALLDSARQTVQAFNDIFRVTSAGSTPATTTVPTAAPLFSTAAPAPTAPAVVTTTPAASTVVPAAVVPTAAPLTPRQQKAAALAQAKAALAANKAAKSASSSRPFKSVGLPSYFRRKPQG